MPREGYDTTGVPKSDPPTQRLDQYAYQYAPSIPSLLRNVETVHSDTAPTAQAPTQHGAAHVAIMTVPTTPAPNQSSAPVSTSPAANIRDEAGKTTNPEVTAVGSGNAVESSAEAERRARVEAKIFGPDSINANK